MTKTTEEIAVLFSKGTQSVRVWARKNGVAAVGKGNTRRYIWSPEDISNYKNFLEHKPFSSSPKKETTILKTTLEVSIICKEGIQTTRAWARKNNLPSVGNGKTHHYMWTQKNISDFKSYREKQKKLSKRGRKFIDDTTNTDTLYHRYYRALKAGNQKLAKETKTQIDHLKKLNKNT